MTTKNKKDARKDAFLETVYRSRFLNQVCYLKTLGSPIGRTVLPRASLITSAIAR
ncbi:MAG: hypothetical protein A4E57_03528 [Syntrophorhabdaceae bacterium PtaU1.Bin034]|nr:MAG: hypothetical protein A4E57_03528 [Syntrophorhabdaceae bacterium PtaU1.Bin034]